VEPQAPPGETKSSPVGEEAPPTKTPVRIAPFHVLKIRANHTLPADPVDGLYLVEPDGKVELGTPYGRVALGGRTLDEAAEAVGKQLSAVVKGSRAQVTLAGWVTRWRNDPARRDPYRIKPLQVLNIQAANTLPSEPIAGPHLVDPDGKVALGLSYGKVAVEGLTLEEAAAAILKTLSQIIKDPQVSVTMGGWDKAWHNLEKDGPEEADAPPPSARKDALRFGGKSFEQWRTELTTELDPGVRVKGIKALSAFGSNGYGSEAVRAILDVMKGYDSNALIDQDDDLKVFEAARTACNKIGAAGVPALQKGLKDPGKNVRKFAVLALGYMGSTARAAAPDLITMIRDEDPSVRYDAIQAVDRTDNKVKSYVPALAAALKDQQARVRERAALALGRIGPGARPAVPALVEALKDDEPNVRLQALRSLDDLAVLDASLTPALIALLKDDNGQIRLEAISYLTKMGPKAKAAVPSLIEVMRPHDTRLEAIRALGAIGPDAKEAAPALNSLLKTTNFELRAAAVEALGKINK
jgi:HEAT repeat protein/protein involved in polysaccharide export with SLBB domain